MVIILSNKNFCGELNKNNRLSLAKGFEMPEYKELLKSLGIEGEWEGVGHCILGYPGKPITDIPKRKENRVYYIK